MYHVSAQGVDERMINVHYYYERMWGGGGGGRVSGEDGDERMWRDGGGGG